MAKHRENNLNDARDKAELTKSYHLDVKNIDDFLDLLSGNLKAPPLPGEDIEKISKPIDDNYLSAGSEMSSKKKMILADLQDDNEEIVEEDDENENVGLSSLAKLKNNNVKVNKYSQITKHLERFSFSNNPEEKEAQLSEIEETLRSKLNEMTIKQVAQNTKNAFAKYANKFSLIPGGIKVGFSFGKKDIFIIAKGSFYGDEIIAVDTNGDQIIPQVIKVANNRKQDLSKNFEINIIK